MMTLTLRRLESKFVFGVVGSDRRERDRDQDRIKSYQKWHTSFWDFFCHSSITIVSTGTPPCLSLSGRTTFLSMTHHTEEMQQV